MSVSVSGSSSNSKSSSDTLGSVAITTKNHLEGYIKCDGSQIDYNATPELWHSMYFKSTETVSDTVTDTSYSGWTQAPCLYYCNGFYITTRYRNMRFRAENGTTWASLSLTSVKTGDLAASVYLAGVDYYDNKFVFLFGGKKSSSSDSYYTNIYTYDGSNLVNTGFSISGTNSYYPTCIEKVGDYYIIKFSYQYGYNDAYGLAYCTNPINNSWTHIRYAQGSTNGKHTGVSYVTRDVIYVDGKYITCGFYTNPATSKLTPCVAYHTDIVGNVSDWTRIFLGDGEDTASYSYNQTTCVRLAYLPNSGCYLVQMNKGSVSGTTYTTSVWYSYDLSQGFTKSNQNTFYLLKNTSTSPSIDKKMMYYDGWLYNDNGYAIPDIEGYTGDPCVNYVVTNIKTATSNYPHVGWFCGPNNENGILFMKQTNSNDIYSAKKFLPTMTVPDGLHAFIKAE